MFDHSLVVMATTLAAGSELPSELQHVMSLSLYRTIGTGCLLAINGRKMLVSCRHVIEDLNENENLAAQAFDGQTIRLNGLQRYVHHEDSRSSTRDIVCMPFNTLSDTILRTIVVPEEAANSFVDGCVLEAWGYPVEKLRDSPKPEGALRRVTCKFVADSRGTDDSINYELKRVSQCMAMVIDKGDVIEFAGMSGGLVFRIQSDSRVPVGIITGSAVGTAITNFGPIPAESIQFVPLVEINKVKLMSLI